MYLQTFLKHKNNSKEIRYQLYQHFFKPYGNIGSFTHGFFYPLEAIFEETLPNLILSVYFAGQAFLNTFTSLGYFLMGQTKEAAREKNNSLNAIVLSIATFVTALLAPVLEAVRFFTRWGASVAFNVKSEREEINKTLKV